MCIAIKTKKDKIEKLKKKFWYFVSIFKDLDLWMNFDEKFVWWILETNIGSHTPTAPVLSIYQYLQCQECHKKKHKNVIF